MVAVEGRWFYPVRVLAQLRSYVALLGAFGYLLFWVAVVLLVPLLAAVVVTLLVAAVGAFFGNT